MNSTTREIITLQVGHYANFVGTHWWNIQEASFNYDKLKQTEINHDFMFREGITPNRLETYTPRLLAIDAKGSLNTLPCYGSLYEATRTPSPLEASWDGSVTLVQQLQGEKNDFLKDLEKDDARYLKSVDEDKDICTDDASDTTRSDRSESPSKIYDLKKTVNVWSDFLHPHLHPKSVYVIGELNHGEGYWGFLPGVECMNKESNQEEVIDRIRLLAEDCGSLQGFHLLLDGHNGMAGVGCGVAQHIADEYSSKDTLSFPIIPPHFSAENLDISSHYLATLIQCYTELASLTNLVVPMNLKRHSWSTWSPLIEFPLLNYDISSAYENSSINAAFLDTISMAYRSCASPLPISHLVEILSPGGRKFSAGSFAFPVGLPSDIDLLSWLKDKPRISLTSMTSGCDVHNDLISECLTLRGLHDKISRPGVHLPPGMQYRSVAQLYEHHLQEKNIGPHTRYVSSIKDPIKMPNTFPNIFDKSVDSKGFVDLSNTSPKVSSLPSIAGLHQGSGVGETLRRITTSGSELNISRLPNLLEDGIDCEGWADQLEILKQFAETYGRTITSSDDSDDDY